MKLTKIELNEGIRLTELRDNETVYKVVEDNTGRWYDAQSSHKQMANPPYVIIRDNKVINIIKDEEYNNDKPYLIKKNDNIIIGFLELSSRTYWYGYIAGIKDAIEGETLNDLIAKVNHEGYDVYKQE
jgi:hypothetical protein